MCEVVVLLIKKIVLLTFSLSSASLDLKVPSLRNDVSERRTAAGSELSSLLISLGATKFAC